MEITEIENINGIVSRQLVEYDDRDIHAQQYRFECEDPSRVQLNGPGIIEFENMHCFVYQPFVSIRSNSIDATFRLISMYRGNVVSHENELLVLDIMPSFIAKWTNSSHARMPSRASSHEIENEERSISRDSSTDVD